MCRELICWICFAVVLVLVGHASGAIPDGWSDLDIGTTGGSANEAGGTWTISGDGADVWGSSDAFHYAYLPLSGNVQITARVVSRGTGSDRWSKGGVMIRETLARSSKNAIMAITGGEGGGLTFQNRPTTGGRSYSAHGNPTAVPPHWVRLKREGDTITAYSSADGVDWVQQPDGVTTDATPNPVDIQMATDVFIGLFVTSHAAGEVRTYTFDNVTVGHPVTATEPEPEDGAVHPDTWAVLSWIPGSTADSHDMYFGESFVDISNRTGDTFRGNQPSSYFDVGLPGSPYPDGLVRGTTYYWRVDEVEIDGVTRHRGDVWRFVVSSAKAYNPVPPDNARFVATDVTLTWAAGFDTRLHTVCFGDDFDAVANAEVGRTQPVAEYVCRSLEPDKTYYWRVDEFDGQATHKGDVWSFTTRPADLASAAFYYVDAGNPDARDTNPGTEGRPWKTIRRGTQSLQPGDILLIKAGTYRETVILNRSGTAAKPIRIWAYPGDEGKVIINAAEPVTDWQRCAGPGDCAGNPYWEHIYVADVAALVESHPDSAFAIRQVFQNGELLNRSRCPDAGWRYPTAITDPKQMFTDSSLSKPNGYFVGSVCHVKTAIWHIDQIPITDFSQGVITLSKSSRYDISTRFGYYITSVVGEINEEGEWAYDPVEKKLFLWPKGDVAQGVEFTYREYCVRTYDGTSWNIVRGLAMHNAYRYGIWLYQANDMTIENNTVEHIYSCGIFVQATNGQCVNNRIINNTVKYSAATGIGVDLTASDNRIEGNYVYATGTEHFGGDLMHGQSFGVYISGPFAQVYNNRIDRAGYTALYIDGKTLGRDISHNYITNIGLALSDGGGIYTGGFSDVPETDYIHHNIIEDAIGCLSMYQSRDIGLPVTIEKYSGDTPGIYVDERGNNRIIEHNTVIGSHMAGIFFHWAPGNIVQKNTLYGNKVAQVWFSGKNEASTRLENDDLIDNIMFATDAQQKTFSLGMNYDNVHFGRSEDNYFYNPFNYRHVLVSCYRADEGRWTSDELTLDQWRRLSGYDEDSREFSYLDRFDDITIDSPIKSRIIYNPSLDVISIDLKPDKYCDVQGNKIYGSVTLQPFESKILISSDFEIAEPTP
ncbi:MAG TPA: right-handed parallel beta-helix repeat-containing protein [Sedimentisphaerales bacterium]|nr:right-handed parallel beta-helix repeat-containing protein [Sedimentisphaerales bacterium]